MNSTCKKLQEMLAAEGPEVLQNDDAAQRHLEECDACFSFLETLQELNTSLREMPRVDAPEPVVEKLLSRPELQTPARTKTESPEKALSSAFWHRWGLLASAAAFALLLITLSIPSLYRARISVLSVREVAAPELREDIPTPRAPAPQAPARPAPKAGALDDSVREEAARAIAPTDIPTDEQEENRFAFEAGKAGELSRDKEQVPANEGLERQLTPHKIVDAAPVYPAIAKRMRIQGTVALRIVIDTRGNVTDAKVVSGQRLLRQAAIDAVMQWKYEPQSAPVEIVVRVDFELKDPGPDSLDGLAFHPTRGYWANTYLPGDPEMRFLHARLQQFSAAQLRAFTGTTPRLHQAAHQPFQPFDASENAAMAMYVHADRRGVSGEKRLLIQVGLKGVERRAGRRPAMNVGVVLDLRGDVPLNVAQGMRALMTALNQAKELGDRFRLVAAGRPGGVVLRPEAFRHGTLKAALDQLFAPDAPSGEQASSIVEAMKTAIQEVGYDDDPAAVLGTSLVLLITGQPLGETTQDLAILAHQSAVAGIPVTVVGIGGGALPHEINHVALSGQGNRRLLEQPSDADRLVDLEFTAASRVVARAVRLNIRLAEGVRLVDILRSEPLDQVRTQQVREAEQSIDTRLNLNLGIEADRGDEDDGIQILIPNFYAGDEHAILLDVVAPGPGTVAQVTMRYKDLAFLKNQVTQASLALARGEETRGPLELNVLKNERAVRLAEALEQAGMALSRGQTAEAAGILTKYRDELTRTCSEITGLLDDDTRNDLELIDEYLLLLKTPAVQNASLRNHLADSLRYAGWLKIQPPLTVS